MFKRTLQCVFVLTIVLGFMIAAGCQSPSPTAPFVSSGKVNFDKGKYDQAVADYTKAIELDPKAIDAYIGIGNAYFQKGKYDESLADFKKAVELRPGSAEALTGRGRAY